MEKFVWTEALSVGVPMIDIQHKELIVAINDLADAVDQGKGANSIKKLLIFLKYYSEWHFEHEEKCALTHQCAIASTNQQAHQKFLQIVTDLQEKYRLSEDKESVAIRAYRELSDWLVSHIMKIDTQIGACVRQSLN
jgi:hemerythrin